MTTAARGKNIKDVDASGKVWLSFDAGYVKS